MGIPFSDSVRSRSALVTALSDNAGRLMHETETTFGIPYSVSLDRMPLAIQGVGEQVIGRAADTVQSGTLTFTIGQFGPAWAGRYNDVLTLTLRAY
jgi:hypothetical protein